MSGSDGPSVATAAAAVAVTQVPTVKTTQAEENSDMKQVWKFIYIDMVFIKSRYGILVGAELVSE